jgi:hypothetical protein
MHECRRVEGLISAPPTTLCTRESMELVVHQREHLVERRAITLLRKAQTLRDLVR